MFHPSREGGRGLAAQISEQKISKMTPKKQQQKGEREGGKKRTEGERLGKCSCFVLLSMVYILCCCSLAVTCPAGSAGTVPGTSGTGGTSGCTVDAGYSGSVTATSTDPFFTSTIAGTLGAASRL